jgi:hypothetical protein
MSRRLTLKDIQATAKALNGRCLDKTFTNCRTTMRWQCHFGHEWQAPIFRVRWGRWCPVCRVKMRERRVKARFLKAIKLEEPGYWAEQLLRVDDRFTRSWIASMIWWSYNLPARDTLPDTEYEDCPLYQMMDHHINGQPFSESCFKKAMKSIGLPAPSLVVSILDS